MIREYKGYYEFLKDEMDRFRGDFDNYIFYVPEFFKLLCDLLNEDIEKEDRNKISCALGYFVAPEDVIPEEIYGPAGYIDDIFLCCFVLNDLKDKYGIKLLKSLWNHDEDLEFVLNYSYKESSKIIKEKNLEDEILKYVGLK